MITVQLYETIDRCERFRVVCSTQARVLTGCESQGLFEPALVYILSCLGRYTNFLNFNGSAPRGQHNELGMTHKKRVLLLE